MFDGNNHHDRQLNTLITIEHLKFSELHPYVWCAFMASPHKGNLRTLFFSTYNCRTGFLDRELLPLSITKRKTKRPGSIKLVKRHSRFSRYGNTSILLHKMEISRPETRLAEIAGVLGDQYIKKTDGLLIGIQLELDGNRRTWVNPALCSRFDKLRETRNHRKILENNGATESQIRFWRKLETLQEAEFIDFGIWSHATVSLLESEIKNFMQGFSLRV